MTVLLSLVIIAQDLFTAAYQILITIDNGFLSQDN